VAIPPLVSHVTDTIGLLSPITRGSLENNLKAFEDQKGSQVTVLIVNSTESEAIESYSLRVAESWKIGRKKIDDGVILVVAKSDRKVRIEVGYGLEGALPDATCKQIIENFITPEFRTGNFDAGVQAGIEAILKKLSGEELPRPEPKNDTDWVLIMVISFLILMTIYNLFHPSRGMYFSSGGGGGWSSGGGGGGGFSGGGGSFGGGGASGSW